MYCIEGWYFYTYHPTDYSQNHLDLLKNSSRVGLEKQKVITAIREKYNCIVKPIYPFV